MKVAQAPLPMKVSQKGDRPQWPRLINQSARHGATRAGGAKARSIDPLPVNQTQRIDPTPPRKEGAAPVAEDATLQPNVAATLPGLEHLGIGRGTPGAAVAGSGNRSLAFYKERDLGALYKERDLGV